VPTELILRLFIADPRVRRPPFAGRVASALGRSASTTLHASYFGLHDANARHCIIAFVTTCTVPRPAAVPIHVALNQTGRGGDTNSPFRYLYTLHVVTIRFAPVRHRRHLSISFEESINDNPSEMVSIIVFHSLFSGWSFRRLQFPSASFLYGRSSRCRHVRRTCGWPTDTNAIRVLLVVPDAVSGFKRARSFTYLAHNPVHCTVLNS